MAKVRIDARDELNCAQFTLEIFRGINQALDEGHEFRLEIPQPWQSIQDFLHTFQCLFSHNGLLARAKNFKRLKHVLSMLDAASEIHKIW